MSRAVGRCAGQLRDTRETDRDEGRVPPEMRPPGYALTSVSGSARAGPVNLCATIEVDVAPATHEELGMLAQGGLPSDTEAFGRLIETHRRDVVLLCYRFLGSLHKTEEAAQETALRAW